MTSTRNHKLWEDGKTIWHLRLWCQKTIKFHHHKPWKTVKLWQFNPFPLSSIFVIRSRVVYFSPGKIMKNSWRCHQLPAAPKVSPVELFRSVQELSGEKILEQVPFLRAYRHHVSKFHALNLMVVVTSKGRSRQIKSWVCRKDRKMNYRMSYGREWSIVNMKSCLLCSET